MKRPRSSACKKHEWIVTTSSNSGLYFGADASTSISTECEHQMHVNSFICNKAFVKIMASTCSKSEILKPFPPPSRAEKRKPIEARYQPPGSLSRPGVPRTCCRSRSVAQIYGFLRVQEDVRTRFVIRAWKAIALELSEVKYGEVASKVKFYTHVTERRVCFACAIARSYERICMSPWT